MAAKKKNIDVVKGSLMTVRLNGYLKQDFAIFANEANLTVSNGVVQLMERVKSGEIKLEPKAVPEK